MGETSDSYLLHEPEIPCGWARPNKPGVEEVGPPMDHWVPSPSMRAPYRPRNPPRPLSIPKTDLISPGLIRLVGIAYHRMCHR